MDERNANTPGPGLSVIVRSLAYGVAFYGVTAVFLLGGIWLLLGPRRWAMRGLALHGQVCVKLLELICGTRMEVRGQENVPAGGYLVIAKHQSAWDTFALIPLFSDPAVVLKDELKYIPVYGWFCLKFEHILVKRQKASLALKALINAAAQRIAQGREILIFPEGTRTAPGAPPQYKPGYIALYEALNVPAVPLALNSGLFWPRRSIWRYPGTIVVEFLPALPPGLPRVEMRKRIEGDLESASLRLIAEAAASPAPPPLPEGFNRSAVA